MEEFYKGLIISMVEEMKNPNFISMIYGFTERLHKEEEGTRSLV